MKKSIGKVSKINLAYIEKIEVFCLEYIKDFNGTRSALAAGYSRSCAPQMAHELLKRPEVQEQLKKLKEERMERLRIDADGVLLKLLQTLNLNIKDIMQNGEIKTPDTWPEEWQTLTNFTVTQNNKGHQSLRWNVDKTKTLQLIGQHVEVNAFKQNLEDEENVDIAQEMQKAIDRRRRMIMEDKRKEEEENTKSGNV